MKFKLGYIHYDSPDDPPSNCRMLRLMMEQWGQDFWDKTIASVDDRLADIYKSHKTYRQQFTEACKKEELLLCFNTRGENFGTLESMTASVINTVREYFHFTGRLVITAPNEATEHMNFAQYKNAVLCMRSGIAMSKYHDTILSAGCHSANQYQFYSQIFDELSDIIDLVDFHIANDALTDSVNWMVKESPKNLICSEFYCYDDGMKAGMDSPMVSNKIIALLDLFKRTPKIQSCYVLFPSLHKDSTIFKKLAFRLHDNSGKIVDVSSAWMTLTRWWKEYSQMEYNRIPDLQAIVDAWNIGNPPYQWDLPWLSMFIVGKKDPTNAIHWADLDAMYEKLMKARLLNVPKELLVPNIKYNADGTWNAGWQAITKSNPKLEV